MILEMDNKKGILELKNSYFAVCNRVFYRKVNEENIEKIEFTFIDNSNIKYYSKRKLKPNIEFTIKKCFINLNSDKLMGIKENYIFRNNNLEEILNELLNLYKNIDGKYSDEINEACNNYMDHLNRLGIELKEGKIDKESYKEEQVKLIVSFNESINEIKLEKEQCENEIKNDFGYLNEEIKIECNDYKGKDNIEVVEGKTAIKNFAENIDVEYSELIKQIYDSKRNYYK